MKGFFALLAQELRLAVGQLGDVLTVLLFFLLVGALVPLGVGPGPDLLARIAAPMIWLAALLAALLGFDRLFQPDFEEGRLELFALSPLPLEAVAAAKALSHWLTTGLPVVLLAPLLAMILALPLAGLPVLLLSLAVGSLSLSLLGTAGSALVLGARRAGMLTAVLLLPLCAPVLIFGTAAVEASLTGATPRPHLLLLTAQTVLMAAVGPVAAAAALKEALR